MISSAYLLSIAALLVALAGIALNLVLMTRLKRLESLVAELYNYTKLSLKSYRVIGKGLSLVLSSYTAEKLLDYIARRRRRRYIAFCISTEDGVQLDPNKVERTIIEAMTRLGGVLGVAEAKPQLVYYDAKSNCGVFRVTYMSKHLAIAAMGFVRNIGGKKVVIIPLRTSGTVKRAKKSLPVPR